VSTNVYLKSKIEERTSQAAVIENLQKTAADAKRDLTEDERKTFDSIVERLAFLDSEIKRLTDAEQGAAKFVQIYGAHQEAEAAAAAARDRERDQAPPRPEERAKTWGTRFIESDQFKAYSGHGSSQPFKIDGEFLEERQADTPITTGIGTPPQYWSGPRDPALRVPLFDVVGVVPTTMGSVEYYYWQPETGMASEVPENTLKPEAPIQGVLLAVPMSTYAWWKGITRQALEDVPMVRTIVDTQLRRGVIRKINAEAAVALAADTNIPTHGTGASVLLESLRVGLGMVDEAGYSANAVLLNALDWAALDMTILPVSRDGANVSTVFWGLRAVAVPQIPRGTAYVGDFAEGMTFFDRNQVSVMMTDSHEDFFLRNKLVLLAEARGKVVVSNAACLVKCAGTVPPANLSGVGPAGPQGPQGPQGPPGPGTAARK
jgi:HK97 family phage major capsid protein